MRSELDFLDSSSRQRLYGRPTTLYESRWISRKAGLSMIQAPRKKMICVLKSVEGRVQLKTGLAYQAAALAYLINPAITQKLKHQLMGAAASHPRRSLQRIRTPVTSGAGPKKTGTGI